MIPSSSSIPSPFSTLLSLLLLFLLLSTATPQLLYTGVYETGLETCMTSAGPARPRCLPGQLGWDYSKPSLDSVDHFTRDWGVNVIRVPIVWERVQPALLQPLSISYLNLLDEIILWTTTLWSGEASIIIDLFNYGRYNNSIVGSDVFVSATAFVDLWTRLALRYGGSNGKIMFALMNSPTGIDRKVWWAAVQQTITAIRATGAQNMILASGNCFSSARDWTSTICDAGAESNARWSLAISDPLNNTILDMTQFFDGGNVGTGPECILDYFTALGGITKWLKDNAQRAFLGKFGLSSRPSCLEQLPELLSYLNEHSDVWMGWTYYGAGNLDNDVVSIEATSWRADHPQTKIMGPYFVGNSLGRGVQQILQGNGSNTGFSIWEAGNGTFAAGGSSGTDMSGMGWYNVTGWSQNRTVVAWARSGAGRKWVIGQSWWWVWIGALVVWGTV